MIFLTVGTQFPFDRLVRAVDDALDKIAIGEEVFGQIGAGSYRPRNFTAVNELEKHVYDQHVRRASGLISHAGMGTITMALDHSKPLLVMPRLKKHGEVVNDHQVAIAGRFAESGHLLVAYGPDDLAVEICKLKSFVPRPRQRQTDQVARRIERFLAESGFDKI